MNELERIKTKMDSLLKKWEGRKEETLERKADRIMYRILKEKLEKLEYNGTRQYETTLSVFDIKERTQ